MNSEQAPIGASRADLALACSHWVKPDTEWSEESGDNMPRDIGIAFHELASQYLSGSTPERLNDLPSRAKTEALARLTGWADSWESMNLKLVENETHYVIDVRTGEYYKFDGDFHAWRKTRQPHEIPVVIDIVATGRDGSLGVIDIKTGQDLMTAPSRSAQLLLAAHVTGAAWAGFHYITETGRIRQRAEPVSQQDILALLDRLRVALELPTEPSPGEHCTKHYCPALVGCPAVAERVASLIPLSALRRRCRVKPESHFGIESSSGLADALSAKKQAERLIDALSAGIKAYARKSPELPNGRVYSQKMQTRASFNRSSFAIALDLVRKEASDRGLDIVIPDMRDEEFNKGTEFPVWRERKAP